MKFYQCKCGAAQSWGSLSPNQCRRCATCGSDLATGPSLHRDPKPHAMRAEQVSLEIDEGLMWGALTRCIWCRATLAAVQKKGEPHEPHTVPA